MHENEMTEAAAHEAGSGKTLAILTGIGIGAALMYFLDAARGAERRHLVADKARSYVRQGSEAASGKAADLRNRAKGALNEMRQGLGGADTEVPLETTYSGEFGARNRSTPGRTPGELGLDADEMRGHGIVGESPERTI